MAGVSASSAADADRDPDLTALEDLLGPPKRRAPKEREEADGDAPQDQADAPPPQADAEAPVDGDDVPSEAPEDREGPVPEDKKEPREPSQAPPGNRASAEDPEPEDDAGAVPAGAPHVHDQRVLEAERLPAATTLSPMEPAMGLTDTLRKDRFITVPARPWPRVAAVAVAGAAALLWVLSLRSAARGSPWPSLGLPASWWLFLLAVSGVAGYFVVVRVWPERTLRLPVAPSQKEQFQRLERGVELLRRAMVAGLAGAAGGLLVLGLAYRFVPAPWLLGLGSLLVAGGAVVAVGAAARWRPMRLLYVQTLVLQRLEGMGLGRELALDPRTAEVLLALDRLLGQLPESSLRQFLSRPEAQWYLELIQKLKGGRGAG